MKLMTGNNYNTSQNCIKLWRLKWKVHLLLWRHIKRVNNESLNLEKCHCKHTICPADVCFLLLYQKGGWQQKHYVPMCCFFALPRRLYGRQHLTPEQSEGSNFGGEKTPRCLYGSLPHAYVASIFSLLLLWRYLNWWRHAPMSSERLFKLVDGSASRIWYFSLMHTSHRLDPHWYGTHFWTISHDTFSSLPCSRSFQTYSLSPVWPSLGFGAFILFTCLYHLSLNVLPARPM